MNPSVYEALAGQAMAARTLIGGTPDRRDLTWEIDVEHELEHVTRWLGLCLAAGGTRAATYALEPSVVALTDVAAASFPGGPYRPEDAPARVGFIWLPEPMHLTLDLSAGPPGSTYAPEPTTVQCLAWALDSYGDALFVIFPGATNEVAGLIALRIGEDAPAHDGIRWVRSFWAFVQQRVVVTEPAHFSRPVRRQAEREGGSVEGIRVVTLRRIHGHDAPAGSAEAVAWSHRWMVRGHWRQQPYRSSGAVKRIWIWPYVKGPEDKPLVPKATVFDVAR